MVKIQNVTVAGSGVLGSQIAFQAGFHGFRVKVYDVNEEALERGKEKIRTWQKAFQKDLGPRKKRWQKDFRIFPSILI